MGLTVWGWVALIGGPLLLIVTIWLIKRLGGSLLGPLFLYEMVVLARRGQQLRLRVLFAIALLVGLFIAYLRALDNTEILRLFSGETVTLKLDRQSAFAETFLVAFLTVQLLAVMLITPALAGSAISEEIERRTLDYLRSTMLSPWEIGMGKFFARMVFLFAIIATGIPVLGLAMSQGGIEERYVFGGYVITIGTAFSLGGFSFYLGTKLNGLREVLFYVYGLVGVLSIPGLCCGCFPGVAVVSPVSALLYMFRGHWTSDLNHWAYWLNILLFGVAHTLFGLGWTLRAIFLIRIPPPIRHDPKIKRRRVKRDTYYDDDDDDLEEEEPPPPPPPTVAVEVEKPRRRPIAKRRYRVERVPDTGDPFLWKERYFGGKTSAVEAEMLTGCGIAAVTIGLFIVGLILFFFAVAELERGQWSGEAVNIPLRTLVAGFVLGTGLIAGVRLSSCVAFERQRQTLDALLTIPVPRSRILWGKMLATLYLLRYPLLFVMIILVGGVVSIGVHPLAVGLAVLYLVGYLSLLAGFGLWMSVRCKTVTRATVYVLIFTMVLWFGPLIASPLADIGVSLLFGQDVSNSFGLSIFSPPVAIWMSLFGWNELRDAFRPGQIQYWVNWVIILVMGIVQLGLAGICWLAAWRRFEEEGR